MDKDRIRRTKEGCEESHHGEGGERNDGGANVMTRGPEDGSEEGTKVEYVESIRYVGRTGARHRG